jgi:addiction module HigA family antidote
MISRASEKFNPDYAIHPGEYLAEILDARGISQADLSRRTNLSDKTLNLIIHGKEPVTPETSISLERVLGVSANIWNGLNADYELRISRIAEQENHKPDIAWAKKFPKKYLVQSGLMEAPNDDLGLVNAVLKFFGVANRDAFNSKWRNFGVSFKISKSSKYSFENLVTWLRIGELWAEKASMETYDRQKFADALDRIRALTVESKFDSEMKELCANSGVVLVFLSELPNMHLSGASFWHQSKAVIMLSLRYHQDDRFWFSFFHEAAHILKHGKKETFIEDIFDRNRTFDKKEDEANNFAEDLLLPPPEFRKFRMKQCVDCSSIIKFARELNIAPGIVAGRLQKEKMLNWDRCHHLFRSLELIERVNYAE